MAREFSCFWGSFPLWGCSRNQLCSLPSYINHFIMAFVQRPAAIPSQAVQTSSAESIAVSEPVKKRKRKVADKSTKEQKKKTVQ